MKIIPVLVIALCSLCTTGCVTTQLHAAIKQMTNEDSVSKKEVDQPTLELIQLLRTQQSKPTRSELFSYHNNDDKLAVIQLSKLEYFLANLSSEVTIYIAPASTDSGFQQMLLVNKRASEINKYLSKHRKDAEVVYAPKQKTNTLKVVLGS